MTTIFCFPDNFEDHLYHLDRTLQRCADNNLYINFEKKAAVGAAEEAVLGFEAGKGEKSITVDGLAATSATPAPATREAMKRWLGVVSFLRILVPDFPAGRRWPGRTVPLPLRERHWRGLNS